jgi:hypothetical protein
MSCFSKFGITKQMRLRIENFKFLFNYLSEFFSTCRIPLNLFHAGQTLLHLSAAGPSSTARQPVSATLQHNVVVVVGGTGNYVPGLRQSINN